jgi:hypothetical protein
MYYSTFLQFLENVRGVKLRDIQKAAVLLPSLVTTSILTSPPSISTFKAPLSTYGQNFIFLCKSIYTINISYSGIKTGSLLIAYSLIFTPANLQVPPPASYIYQILTPQEGLKSRQFQDKIVSNLLTNCPQL